MLFELNFTRTKSTIERLVGYDYWTLWYGIGRSFLALGLLITLSLNSTETLFYFGINDVVGPSFNSYTSISIYNIIGNLQYATYASIAILVLVILGVYPQITGLLHWWVTYSFFVTSYAIDGGDQISTVLSFLLIPICLTDKRKNHWISSRNHHLYSSNYTAKIVAFFAYLLISIQVAYVYFEAAISKFQVKEWVNGTAVYYWFTHHVFGVNELLYPLILPILKNPFLVTFITWGVLLLEIFLFSCIFIKNKKIKKVAYVIGLIFHLGIVVVHGLVSFFFAMAGALTLFLMARKELKTYA